MDEISKLAVQKGGIESKIIPVDQVVVSDWVYWKCRFGCPHYGTTLTCPPHSPNPEQTRALLQGYEWALLIKYDSPEYHQLLLDLEREAFLSGFYKALGLTAGRCRLCEVCNPKDGICEHQDQVRPSMESCGIDVFATARNAGYSMKVVTSKDEKYHRICMLLIT